MLPKDERYPARVGLPKNTFSTPLFVVRFQTNTLSKRRCAVVVSKRVDVRATARNKIKRQLMEVLQHNVPSDAGYDIVLIAKREIAGKEFSTISTEVTVALETTKIIN